MTAPTIAVSNPSEVPRGEIDPRSTTWTALDLARRRSLATARTELEAAVDRGDPAPVVDAWRELAGRMARAELSRLAGPDAGPALPAKPPDHRE